MTNQEKDLTEQDTPNSHRKRQEKLGRRLVFIHHNTEQKIFRATGAIKTRSKEAKVLDRAAFSLLSHRSCGCVGHTMGTALVITAQVPALSASRLQSLFFVFGFVFLKIMSRSSAYKTERHRKKLIWLVR